MERRWISFNCTTNADVADVWWAPLLHSFLPQH